MLWKGQPSKILASFIISLFLLPGIFYDPSLADAQQHNANFLTYTNTNLGFTIKYPSDWTVNTTKISSDHRVKFTSADGIRNVLVEVRNATDEQMAIATTNDESAKANGCYMPGCIMYNLLEVHN
jgi:hypothetical protein